MNSRSGSSKGYGRDRSSRGLAGSSSDAGLGDGREGLLRSGCDAGGDGSQALSVLGLALREGVDQLK